MNRRLFKRNLGKTNNDKLCRRSASKVRKKEKIIFSVEKTQHKAISSNWLIAPSLLAALCLSPVE